jgi:uncharacterized protein YyaL (SSP411 family)/cytochrome c biogenesis protein CcdA
MIIKKTLIKVFVIWLSFIFIVSFAEAESKYPHERSEKLFHLIHWHEYTLDTFQKALIEQKPIFLVLSAPAWCYWCHVYESEDYLYHPDLYPFINENFIAIFIDSDKRPDLTKKYLEGGWPSTTIFTPDFRRIEGFSGPGDPHKLKEYLGQLIDFLKEKTFEKLKKEFEYRESEPRIPEEDHLTEIELIFVQHLNSIFDETYGGFIQGMSKRKFPTGFVYKFLLEKYEKTGNIDYLNMVRKTFDNQFTELKKLKEDYHLYDPVEGGFHRYSTKRDWSIPHYEKLLSDQAKIVKAYAHLLKITDDDKVRKAVKGSISYVSSKFYDDEGGFYSSQDAYLEDAYYGLTKEERKKVAPPHIDRTRVMDANSMMINTLLYVHQILGNKEYRDIEIKSLNFLQDKMISRRGAYYYYDYDKRKPFLTGQAVSNSWALLAFLNGYDVLGERRYLKTARRLAEYSIDNLYDWNSGGFFERNSKDGEFYAPYERIDLSKPYQENAVFSYSMLRLYLITKDLKYLENGLKTLGYLLTRNPGGLDEVYYVIKASNIVKANNLLTVYRNNQDKIDSLIKQGRSDFFLTKLLEEKQDMTSLGDLPKLRDDLSGASLFILAIIAFLAGTLSFLSPCTLPILPAYFAQGFHAGKGEIVKNTVFFFLGLATIFSLFGMGATLIGSMLRENRIIFTQAAAGVIIIFGVLEIFGKGFSGLNIYLKGSHRTPLGSYLFGCVFATGWSACIGPILASLLLLSATSGTILKGTSLLFIYALGLAAPLTLFSLFFDRIKNKRFWNILRGRELSVSILKRKMYIHTTYLISGLILILLGILIFNDYLYKLNQLTFQTDYVQEIIVKGEEFLKDILVD